MNYKVEDLGQVFTPENIVEKMCDMIQNGERILEPSCGEIRSFSGFTKYFLIFFI